MVWSKCTRDPKLYSRKDISVYKQEHLKYDGSVLSWYIDIHFGSLVHILLKYFDYNKKNALSISKKLFLIADEEKKASILT